MTVIPRWLLRTVLALIVGVAIFTATAEAALVYHAIGPLLAAALGVILFPVLLRGATSGTTSIRSAWGVALTGCLLCFVATIGLDSARVDFVSISWYTCGVLAGAVMLWMAGHRAPPLVAVSCLLLQVTLWAGPLGMIRLGLAAETAVVIAGLLMHRAMERVSAATRAATRQERETTIWQSEQDAFRLERQMRLDLASRNTTPVLQRIIDLGGHLDDATRAECRVLEQTLRDEIRGRHLLNDNVRNAIRAHRERGAVVQVLDDGGLDDLAPCALNPLLDELATRLAPIRSTRVVIRTGHADSAAAITIVATTPDETAAALGIEDDAEQVDLWATIPRPHPVPVLA